MTTDSDYMVRSERIRIHTPEDFDGMRRAGKLAAECLDMLIPHVVPGVATAYLDDLARQFVLDHNAVPACLFYRGYQHTVCISPNHVVCHGIPSDKSLKEGDIANIDVTVIVDGWHGDTSRMYEVGEVAPRAKRLVDVTYESMRLGLEQIRHAVAIFTWCSRLDRRGCNNHRRRDHRLWRRLPERHQGRV